MAVVGSSLWQWHFTKPTAVARDQNVVGVAQVHRAVRVGVLRLEVLLQRQVVAAEAGRVAAEVAVAVLL